MILITETLVIVISFLLTYVIYASSINLFKKYLLDKPNQRSSHIISKPRGGGIVFIFIFFLFSIISIFIYGFSFNSTLPFLILPLIATSLIDDFYDISIKYRFASQIFTSSILVINYLSRFEQQLFIYDAFLFLLFLFFSVSVINFINFLDGIDGLITGSFLIFLIFLSFNYSLDFGLLSLIGGLAAFILFNWEPAKIFMGDVGSTFLGAVYLGLFFNQRSLINSFSIVLIFMPLFIDAITTLIRRIKNKHNVFSAHKLHLYQRLHQAGMSHSNVSLIYILGIGFLSITFTFGNFGLLIFASICEILVGIYLDKFIAVKFNKY